MNTDKAREFLAKLNALMDEYGVDIRVYSLPTTINGRDVDFVKVYATKRYRLKEFYYLDTI